MRILVVEDEQKIANAIKKGLEQESFVVDVAYDGASGYDLAAAESYDVIVLDWMLPGMDGKQIAEKLRKNEVSTPILMLTAKGTLKDKVTGFGVGVDDYLVKPFAFEELVARIRALAKRPVHIIPEIITIDSLEFHRDTIEVKRAGKAVPLSKKEFVLLEYLLKNKGKIVSKAQIIDHVWRFDDDILPNTVEVYIGYLRKKIDKAYPQEKPLIHTIRGFGYKVV